MTQAAFTSVGFVLTLLAVYLIFIGKNELTVVVGCLLVVLAGLYGLTVNEG